MAADLEDAASRMCLRGQLDCLVQEWKDVLTIPGADLCMVSTWQQPQAVT
ncbi:hypothetical protein [Streptomyces sp. F001]|nr:hypothetical protein [Streptomyces sp. F001]